MRRTETRIPPLFREFDRVLEKIHDDLPQASLIAPHQRRKVVGDVDDDLETLAMRIHDEKIRGLVHGGPQIEAGRFEVELSRLDLGKVENVVDETQKHVGRKSHLSHVVGLFRVESRVLQELDDAYDRLDGRSYLVAHVREELAFRVRGLLGLFLGFLEPVLAEDAVGHVLDRTEQVAFQGAGRSCLGRRSLRQGKREAYPPPRAVHRTEGALHHRFAGAGHQYLGGVVFETGSLPR